eukprot:scaffold1480_cov123-Isochrysis_galbana.AAC.7
MRKHKGGAARLIARYAGHALSAGQRDDVCHDVPPIVVILQVAEVPVQVLLRKVQRHERSGKCLAIATSSERCETLQLLLERRAARARHPRIRRARCGAPDRFCFCRRRPGRGRSSPEPCSPVVPRPERRLTRRRKVHPPEQGAESRRQSRANPGFLLPISSTL